MRNGWISRTVWKLPKFMPGPRAIRIFAAIDAADWEEVARARHSAGPDDSADFSYVTYRRRKPH